MTLSNGFRGMTGMQVYVWVEDKVWGDQMQTARTGDFWKECYDTAWHQHVGGGARESKKGCWIFCMYKSMESEEWMRQSGRYICVETKSLRR